MKNRDLFKKVDELTKYQIIVDFIRNYGELNAKQRFCAWLDEEVSKESKMSNKILDGAKTDPEFLNTFEIGMQKYKDVVLRDFVSLALHKVDDDSPLASSRKELESVLTSTMLDMIGEKKNG